MRPGESDGGRRQVLQLATAENNALAEVMFDQREIGNLNYGCQLPPIDFVAFAKACGPAAPLASIASVRKTFQAASPSPVLVEAALDPAEKPAKLDELRA